MDYKEYVAGFTKNNFWHVSKAELIDSILSKHSKDAAKILNVGCGVGNDLNVLKKYGVVTVVDVNKKALSIIKDKQVRKRFGDICSLPFPDKSFDMVVSFDVFEHIKDDKTAVAECKRVLKPKGILVFTVPAFPQLYSTYDTFLGHERRYTKKMIRGLLRNMHIKMLGYWNFLLFCPFVIERLIKRKIPHSPYKLSHFMNSILRAIMKTENLLIRAGIKMPIGLTIYGIAQKA